MAFMNEFVTPEQREEFRTWKLKRPIFGFGSIIREVDMDPPFRWTIDTERSMYLFGTSVDWDYPEEHVFYFRWNHKNFLVQFTLDYIDDNTADWNVPKKYMIDNVFPYCTEERFLDDLRDALLAYGTWGQDFKGDRNIKCNF